MPIGIKVSGIQSTSRGLASMALRMNMAKNRALKSEGEFVRRKLVEGLRNSRPGGTALAPLSPITVMTKTKQDPRPLIDTGSLLGAMTSRMVGGAVFVGIMDSARNAKGDSLAAIMEKHERGYQFEVTVTNAMRFAVIKKMERSGSRAKAGKGKGILVPGKKMLITVPSRPLFGNVADWLNRNAAQTQKRFADKFALYMFGAKGKV